MMTATQTPIPGDSTAPAEAAPSRLWDWLTFGAVVVLVFHLMGLWYRWARPDPQFLGLLQGEEAGALEQFEAGRVLYEQLGDRQAVAQVKALLGR